MEKNFFKRTLSRAEDLLRSQSTVTNMDSPSNDRKQANALWNGGEKEQALTILRKARREYPKDALLSLSYGTKLFQLNEYFASREALLDALELDPGNSHAFELLLEAEKHFPIDPDIQVSLYENLAKNFSASEKDWATKIFLLAPKRGKAASVDNVFISLKSYPDDSVQHNLVKYLESPADKRRHLTVSGLSDSEVKGLILAEIILGANAHAFELIRACTEIPISADILRLAARRELRRKRDSAANEYLRFYLHLRPEDRWGKTQLAKLEKNRKRLSSGAAYSVVLPFPFSEAVKTPRYEAIKNRSFYFLHNSLPYDSGGYATRTHGLLTAMNGHGWDVNGVTRYGYPLDRPGFGERPTTSEDHHIDNVIYRRLTDGVELPVRKSPLLSYVMTYADSAEKLAEEHKPQILHGVANHWNGLASAELGNRLGIPSVYEVRGLWEVTRASREKGYSETEQYRQRAALEAEACNASDSVITITNALKAEMIRRGVPEEKISVVPNGVDTTRFTPLERDEKLAEKLGINDRTVIGYVGSVVDYEGLDDLMEVAIRFKDKRDDVVFLIVGDGAVFPQIQEKVSTYGLESSVILTGRVPHEEVESYYSLIDICPFPRKPLPVCEMVSPLKPFEALAMQKALVASNVDALAEIIQDGETGLLFEKGSIDSLEEQLSRLLDDASLRKRLSNSGLVWVRENRDWSNLAKKVGEIYTSLGASIT